MDSLLSIVQMPAGVPVATVSIGGARNAGLLAVRILGASDDQLRQRMTRFQEELTRGAAAKGVALRQSLVEPGDGRVRAGALRSAAEPTDRATKARVSATYFMTVSGSGVRATAVYSSRPSNRATGG